MRIPKKHSVFDHKKTKLIGVGLLVVAIILGLSYCVLFVKKPGGTPLSKLCSSAANGGYLDRSAQAITASDQVQLKSVVSEFTAHPQYRDDPNCLYISTVYNVNAQNTAAARNDYDRLSMTYKSYSPQNRLLSSSGTVANLGKRIEGQEAQAKAYQANFSGTQPTSKGNQKK